MNINIITSRNEDWFSRQILKSDTAKHNIVCNSKEDIIWDIVVVYENLPYSYQLKCRHGGIVFISGEPPQISCYGYAFLKQFDAVVTCHKHLKHRHVIQWQQSLPWMIGLKISTNEYNMTADNFLQFFPHKTNILSAICSYKKLIPGHKKRNVIIRSLISKFPQIDIYGSNYKFIDDKKDALDSYMFHICIENSEVNDYWTEKISDPILALSVPIYLGCPNIESYFNPDAMIICKTEEELECTVQRVLVNPRAIYEEKLPLLVKEREKLINEYNILPTISKLINEELNIEDEVVDLKLLPRNHFFEYRFLQCFVKLKRFILNIIR